MSEVQNVQGVFGNFQSHFQLSKMGNHKEHLLQNLKSLKKYLEKMSF